MKKVEFCAIKEMQVIKERRGDMYDNVRVN
jgi:hypothetical protein